MPVIKQWVNLDPMSPDALRDVPGEGVITPERCGPVIDLEATLDEELEGIPVWWGVEVHDDNLEPAETPDGGWSSNPRLAGLGGVPGFYEQLAVTDDGGVTRAELHVPECGGDKYTVKVFTKDGDGNIVDELQSETYETWRQLYYQVTRMGAGSGRESLPAIQDLTTWNNVLAEFGDTREPHNIRFTEVPAGSATITRYRCLWSDNMNKRTGVEGYDRAKEPLVLKVSLVDLLADRGEEAHMFRAVYRDTTYTARTRKPLFDVNSADDRDDWFISGHLRTRGSAPQIRRDHFSKAGPTTISLRMENAGTCRSARVKVRVYVFESWWCGFSWYNGIWINNASGRWRGRSFSIVDVSMREKAETMVHEWAHAIGMVPSASSLHYPTSHGHQGGHCWNGATDPSSFPADEDYTPERSEGATCNMFGSNASQTIEFCEVCTPFVRSRKPQVDGNFRRSLMMPARWGRIS